MGERAAQDRRLCHALDDDVIDELSLPAEQPGIFGAQV